VSKGSTRRPCLVSKEEERLRWDLFEGRIELEDFNIKLRELKNDRRKKMGPS
jgi:hypothetical protein